MRNDAGLRTFVARPLPAVVDIFAAERYCKYSGGELCSLARVRVSGLVGYPKGQVLRQGGAEEDSKGGLGGMVTSIVPTSAINGYNKRVEVQAASAAETRRGRGGWAADMHETAKTNDLEIVYFVVGLIWKQVTVTSRAAPGVMDMLVFFVVVRAKIVRHDGCVQPM